MFALPNMIHLLPDKLSRLRRWRLPFPRIFSGPLHGLTLRHCNLLSLLFRFPRLFEFQWDEAVCQSENRCTPLSEAAVFPASPRAQSAVSKKPSSVILLSRINFLIPLRSSDNSKPSLSSSPVPPIAHTGCPQRVALLPTLSVPASDLDRRWRLPGLLISRAGLATIPPLP